MKTQDGLFLFAPVPLEHLESGVGVCSKTGKVAFGSNSWEVFRKLDEERAGNPVWVYIYASGKDSDTPKATWIGRYIGHVESQLGVHPTGMTHRPPTTAQYQDDNKGFWSVFWEVDILRPLDDDDCLPVSAFSGFESNKPYKRNFIPRGPLLVYQAAA